MRSRLTPLLKLFYNPLQAVIEISAEAPYIVGAFLALLSTSLYYELLSGRLTRIIAAFNEPRAQGMTSPIILMVYRVIAGMLSNVSPVLSACPQPDTSTGELHRAVEAGLRSAGQLRALLLDRRAPDDADTRCIVVSSW
jgi:hypothetical protein